MTFNLQAAEAFLLRSFDPSISLLRESPNASPKTYWAFNDAYVASLALMENHFLVAGQLLAQIDVLKAPKTRVVTLAGETFRVLQPVTVTTLKTVGQKTVLTEVPNMNAPPIPLYQYADVALYQALNLFNSGAVSDAVVVFQNAEKMFDGVGFRDASWNGLYQLYKNALYLIVADRLAVNATFRTQCEHYIDGAQIFNRPNFQNQQGGVFTEFSASGYTGDCNVESVSLCLLSRRTRV